MSVSLSMVYVLFGVLGIFGRGNYYYPSQPQYQSRPVVTRAPAPATIVPATVKSVADKVEVQAETEKVQEKLTQELKPEAPTASPAIPLTFSTKDQPKIEKQVQITEGKGVKLTEGKAKPTPEQREALKKEREEKKAVREAKQADLLKKAKDRIKKSEDKNKSKEIVAPR